MSNNSIQVVLNTDSMLENIEPPQGGSRKDFFAAMDEEFEAHKHKLARQLSLIKELQVTNRYATMSYAKVSMRQSALAKSHRPTSAIFPPDISPVVGAGDPGVLFVELKPDSIDETTARIERAEVQSRTKVKDGKTIPKPSQYRCEVGAIDDITPYSEEDKRKFSVNEAVEWLVDPRSGGAYIVELFKDLPPRGEWFNHDKESIQLFDSFVRGLESIQPRPFVEKMNFNFSWPSCLVKNGRCTGFARLTIVSTPPLDYRFGAELVRINVKAALRQLQLDGGYKGRLKAVYMPNKLPLLEKDLIEYSFKWSPVKVHEAIFPRGVGPTTDWQLAVEYLARDGVQVPHQGVPFTAILTISDPNREEPVFNEMRQTLSSLGVRTVNIETATRVTPRV